MGYYITLEDARFFIPADKVESALKAIQDLHGAETISDGSGRHFSWVSNNFYKIDDFSEMMEEWRYPVDFDAEGNVNNIEFVGEKIGDEECLFGAIAPFVKEGSYLEWSGEDNAQWRFKFDGTSYREIHAQIVWDDE